MKKEKRSKWKRRVAAALAVTLLVGNVDLTQFHKLRAYGFSREYGVCTDNHEVSPDGYNNRTDVYQTTTILTQDMEHGSEEWKAAIEHNKQRLISQLGHGDERTVLKVLWGAITTIATNGEIGGMSRADVDEAKYWAERIRRELEDAQFHNYWEQSTPKTMLPMDEPTFGKIRHGAGEADIQKDPLLAALSDPTHLFPGKGQSIANEPGQGWQYDAHWMLPRMGTGWFESYTPEQYGTGGVAQWPVNTAEHSISKKDGEVVTLQEVTDNALDLEKDQAYWEIGEVDANGMLIRKDSSGGKTKTSAAPSDGEDAEPGPGDGGDDGDEDEKPDSSNTKKNTTNHYYITMSVPFQNNASCLNVWDSSTQNWQPLQILSFSSIEVNGWTVSSKIAVDGRTPYIDIVYNGSGTPSDGIVGYFSIPKGSFVSKENTTWDSPMDFAADIMELAECVQCNGGHRIGVAPLERHQKFVKLHHIKDLQDTYPCVKVGPTTDPVPPTPEPEIHFCVFRHQEDWQTDYNVQLNKYDYEMGAEQSPLEGSMFTLYEKFDDKDEINPDNDGSVELYKGTESGKYPDKDWQSGYTSSPVTWNDFREVNSYTTDKNGHIETDVPKNYHYEKTYCDGHPAPKFVPVPEYEEDPETGENNQDEIDEAQETNKTYAKQWIEYYEACQKKAGERSGVHFHWLGDGVLEDTIRSLAESGGSEGETPNGGPTACFGKEKSYESSGCKSDTEQTYDKFINLKYTYTWKETKAREGYIQHDTHTDDVLIEAITTNSSQAGANSQFAIGDEKYDKYITINKSANDTESQDTGEEKTTLFGMLRKAVVTNRADAADDGEADREPLVREDYNFVKSGFVTLKETVLDAVKFITGNLATPSNATDSEADDEDESGQEEYLPDMDLIGKASDAWKEAVGGLFTIQAFAASTPSEPDANEEKQSFSISIKPFTNLLRAEDEAQALSDDDDSGLGQSFESIFQDAFKSIQTDDFSVKLGPDDNWSHCNDEDGEGNAWRVYDHRTEGEIHFNKRDLYLNSKNSGQYDSYAEENGDGTLEGAVYGLFADEDIVHPDGNTDVVYKRGNLVAVATTDRNGDGSFMVYTEAPGVIYNYTTGKIEQTDWYTKAPTNAFRADFKTTEEEHHAVVTDCDDTAWTADDYTADHDAGVIAAKTERLYDDNEANNGNCWIGRPLIMGKYYIKELSRSEGYELSVNGKAREYSNYDAQNPDSAYEEIKAEEEESKGTAEISTNLYINGQESIGGTNEPFFGATSKQTNQNGGYDIIVPKLPEATKFYRKDSTIVEEEQNVQTGWTTQEKRDEKGNIIYKHAASDSSDPIFVGDGSDNVETIDVPVTAGIQGVVVKKAKTFDQDRIDTFLKGAAAVTDEGVTYYPDQIRLSKDFSVSDFRFLKAKLETALRAGGGLTTPSQMIGGVKTYTSEGLSVYSRGIRKGEVDSYGVSGVTPGTTATKTVYGPQIVKVTIKKQVNGQTLSGEDMVRNLIQYYIDHPYYNFGGIDSYLDYSDRTEFLIYASDTNTSGTFAFKSTNSDGYEVYARKGFDPQDTDFEPYYVYVKYTEDGNEDDAFGYYTNLKTGMLSSTTYISAMLTPDAQVEPDGTITAKIGKTTKCYKKGELVYDKNGDPVAEMESVPKYETKTVQVAKTQWTEIPSRYDATSGKHIIHIDVPYTDAYGNVHTDADEALTVALKAVCPENEVHTLTAQDLELLPDDMRGYYNVGDKISCGTYEVEFLRAKASVSLNYDKNQQVKNGSYLQEVELTYPGQTEVFQDGDGVPGHGTIQTPTEVEERPISQRIRIDKDIQKLKESKHVWYCLNCGYENTDGDAICGFCGHNRTTEETKTIDYAHDTYGAVHSENISADREDGWYETVKDWFAKLLKLENRDESTESIGNFRFKAYLKSNLERLYRKADGTITWVDRNGNEMIPQYEDKAADDGNYDTFTWKYKDAFDGKTVDFPEKDKTSADGTLESSNVQKIYTEVEHNKDSKTSSARANNVWASYGTPQGGNTTDVGDIQSYTTSERGASGEAVKDNSSLYSYDGKLVDADRSDKLNDTANSGYTRILESTLTTIEDEGATREVEMYNYEKFFDAIHAANTDIWDDDMHSTYTGDAMKNYPGQHWFKTFYEKYQKDDTDPGHTKANTDGTDKDNTAGGDKDTSFKPFRWIRENVFGYRDGYEKYPADNNGVNTEVTANTSDLARANAEASDAVRQFAVKWYLQDEAAKLMIDNGQGENVALKGGTIGYDEAVYDEALFNAIAKAYNYLKPFYFYDLDTIYSVEWDSAKDGGADKDHTTLSVDELHNGTYYNTSSYLPYGVYVIVEQQPERRDKDVNDWKNRSYDIEKPKEVIVPSVYDAEKSNDTSDNYDPHYNFDTDMSLQKQAKASNYLIRFGEELSDNTANQDEREFVIRAHGYYGDFEVYKYGLDIDGLSGAITAPNGAYGYHGWELRQGYRDPLKDYYEYDHRGEAGVDEIGAELGGNNESKYHGYEQENGNGKDTANGETYDGDTLRKRFFYASVSEDDGTADNVLYKDGAKDDNNASGMNWKDDIPSTTGELTAYDKLYSAALVPWSVTAPADLDTYSSKDFTGYADVKERNSYYVSYLRINKVDSETGEYILHDDAIFGLYAASRYTSFDEIEEDAKLIEDADERARFLMQFKPGDTKFYLKDTYIVGSKEFLEAMGATDLQISTGRTRTPIVESQEDTGHTYTGLVRKGTPVCVESERIDLSDDFGKKTGQMTVWSTKADVKMDDPVTGELKDYGDQTVGYFKTSQPVSAGVYVLAEIKPPAGYARSKPVAIEVYSDESSYYVDGDMYAKVAAVRYDGNLLTDIPYEK